MMHEYNTTKMTLVLTEYGRNIQNMINYILSLKSKKK
ncbi:MAG: DUF4290 domain-containing protein, partial [Bacteroides sp.]